jgi:hypothetical protein
MGLIEYRQSLSLSADGSFYGLIMAAMRNADNTNLEKLKATYPQVWVELQERYNAPGGCLTQNEMTWLENVMAERDNEDSDDD